MNPVDRLWGLLADYGLVVMLLAFGVWAAYKGKWVPGNVLNDIKKDYEDRLDELRSEKDQDIDLLRSELAMWRDMAVDSLRTAKRSNDTAKTAIDMLNPSQSQTESRHRRSSHMSHNTGGESISRNRVDRAIVDRDEIYQITAEQHRAIVEAEKAESDVLRNTLVVHSKRRRLQGGRR